MSSKFVKRGHRCDDSPEAGPSKRDQDSSDEDDEPAQRKGVSHPSSKVFRQGSNMSKKSPGISKQQQQQQQQSGGHGHHNKPAELFRKDLISAMKLADTEILYDDEYFTIVDPWRQEWEKGVQVPVNEEEIPPIKIVDVINEENHTDFKMHPRKYLHEKNDETYQAGQHELTGMQELSEQIVRYDLDDMDVMWLELVNADREEMGLQVINEWNLERMIEELENQCYAKTNSVKKTEEGLGIEYDEDIACDVCRQLESEDTNEMVFCDGCDICVHQACYGIQTIPEGSWLCRICALGIKPMCLLCPKRGGAMKSTKSGARWTHVSCALWIPEVSIGCPEKMEPVTKISNIPASRWALVCCLCKERVGACIQCSVKQCKTAFHVTCGFAHNLDMKTVLDETDELDGIHLRAYCPKHTKNRNASDSESPKKNEEDVEEMEENENDVSEAEMAKQRAEKLKQLEEEFYSLVDEQEISTKFYIPEEAVSVVTEYWKMKRKVNFNKPLITPKVEEENQMQKQQKDSLSARMKMFVHLRQDLERARNLCYMIGKREKTKKQLFKLQESVFNMQVNVLTDPKLDLSSREAEAIRHFIHFDSIYSSFCHKGSVSKLPRKNLFTLENLKTPKDLDEERNSAFEAVIKKKLSKKMKHSKHSKHSKHNSVKKEVKEEPATSDGGNVNSKESAKEEKSGHEIKKSFSDALVDSSDNELTHYEGSKTDSAQMSHLGKVKGGEEVELNESQEEKPDLKDEVLESDNNKRSAGSDLKMKLTSILQSKSLKQKQDKLSQNDLLNSPLYIDAENSDDVLSSESNTDFASPVQLSRNLFDKFKMKEQWSSSDHASPDIPQKDRQERHRQGKKKHRRYKQSKLDMSASEASDSMKMGETKEKGVSSSDNRNIFDIGKEKSPAIASHTVNLNCSDGETQHRTKVRDISPSKLSFHKKRSSKDWSVTSPCEEKPSPLKKQKKMSPSPRVDPDNVYPTIDGDIYVPSGKIQVTERTIVLESPKEVKSKHSNKLRLKKQTNSPVKGVISYEVVKNSDCDERGHISISAKEKMDAMLDDEDFVVENDNRVSININDLPRPDNKSSFDKTREDFSRPDKKRYSDKNKEDVPRSGKKIASERTREDLSKPDRKSASDKTKEDLTRPDRKKMSDKTKEDLSKSDKKTSDKVKEDLTKPDKKTSDKVKEDLTKPDKKSVTDKNREDLSRLDKKKTSDKTKEDLMGSEKKTVSDKVKEDLFRSDKKRTSDKTKEDLSRLEKKVTSDTVKEDLSRSDKKKISDKTKDLSRPEKKATSDKVKEDLHPSDKRTSDKTATEKNSKEGKYGKLLSDSDGNISVEPKENAEELAVRKDLFGISESRSVNKRDRKLKRSSRTKEINLDLDSSSDENFVPSNKSTKLTTLNKSLRPQRECRTNSDSISVIKPFPNRPDLNALVDPSKLIVKEPLKRRIGDKLSQIVKSRTRWGNRLNPKDRSQSTLDSFVKKSTLFSPENDDNVPSLVRPDLKSSDVSRSSLGNGVSPKKFPLANGDVLQRTPSKNSTTSHRLSERMDVAEDKSHSASGLFMDMKNTDRHIDDDVLSIGSVTSRLSGSDAGDRADTLRRSARNRGPDDPQSPQTPSRLRNRDGLPKPPPFKSS